MMTEAMAVKSCLVSPVAKNALSSFWISVRALAGTSVHVGQTVYRMGCSERCNSGMCTFWQSG